MAEARLFFGGWFVLAVLVPALGAQPAVAPACLEIEAHLRQADPLIRTEWRVHPGEIANGAAPALDDRAWALDSPSRIANRAANPAWPGVGWFRLRLLTPARLPAEPLVLDLEQGGAAEIYLDGQRIAQQGEVSSPQRAEVAMLRAAAPFRLPLQPATAHLLAVKYSNVTSGPLQAIDPENGGFRARLLPQSLWAQTTITRQRAMVGVQMFFTAITGMLAFIHFALFVFCRKLRENLMCALFMTALSAFTYAGFMLGQTTYTEGYVAAYRIYLVAANMAGVCWLLTLYTMFGRTRGFSAAALGVGAWLMVFSLFFPTRALFYGTVGYALFCSAEMCRVVWTALRALREDLWMLGAGMLIFGLAILENALRVYGVVPLHFLGSHTLNLGILGLAVSLSLFVSRRYARLSEATERQLVEIQALAAKNLQHEVERSRLIAEQNTRLEQQVAERTAQLHAEKIRTEELLYDILPQEIARELRETGGAAPRRHEDVTVLFSDFFGFTNMVSTIPAQKLVREFNEIYRAFDEIMERVGIEKIKTIGDAYMAAGGVPEPCDDHAIRCVEAALAMLHHMEERNRVSALKWDLRIGLHSGSLIAGVVGKRKFTYDLFGDTVNIASRMESASEPGRINLSAYTYDLIKDRYECQYRGRIEVKGKGGQEMYFLLGPRRVEGAAP